MDDSLAARSAGNRPVSSSPYPYDFELYPESKRPDSNTDTMTLSPPLTLHEEEEDSHPPQQQQQLQQHQNQPSKDHCEDDQSRPNKLKMPSHLINKHVTPFLKEHIPGIYAPVGKNLPQQDDSLSEFTQKEMQSKDLNTRFCYRHRPDSKCRRAADEKKMGVIQRVSTCKHDIQLSYSHSDQPLGTE